MELVSDFTQCVVGFVFQEWTGGSQTAVVCPRCKKVAKPRITPTGKQYLHFTYATESGLQEVSCLVREDGVARAGTPLLPTPEKPTVVSLTHSPTLCVTAGCSNPKHSRGLCWDCYNRLARAVGRKETTWETLEERGLSRPRIVKPPPPNVSKRPPRY